MLADEPPYLSVGTEVSAKYKGAFCEAKVRKVDKTVKCKVTFKLGCGTYTVLDSSIKGTLRVGASVEAKHPEKKEFCEATITKIQDCSQYTVVFDDGDITTLRRSALCLKSGRHFAESETLDQLPLTHPEHFGNPVVGGGGRRGRRRLLDDSSGDEDSTRKGKTKEEKEADIGKVVCVELGDKKKVKDNWFPGLVVAPNAQDTVQIRVKDEYLIRSFSDGRYYTVPKKEATEFTREIGVKVDNNTLKTAVEKALHFIDKDELPPHWDRELLFGLVDSDINSESDEGLDSDSSDDEPREEKDHFVAQLYKFMDDRGTPINNCPSIGGKDLDLYKLFNVVHKLNGYNRVTNRNQWKNVSTKLGLGITVSIVTQVKHAYKKYLHSFEDFYRKLGCTMISHPRNNRARNKSGRSLIRDKDRATPSHPSKVKCDIISMEPSKNVVKVADESSEKNLVAEIKNKEEVLIEKKEEKAKSKEDEIDKNAKGKNIKKDLIEIDEVSESEESLSVSEEAYSVSRPTSSFRKKFPTLKASPIVVREKRKAESSPDARKCKRTRVLKSRSSSGSDIKTTSDGEDDSKSKELAHQRNTTRSRSREDQKVKQDPEKNKKLKTPVGNFENQKKMPVLKAKRCDTEDAPFQKKGRKRRNTETGGKSPSAADEDLNLPCLPTYKSVFIGDILKIYYGAPGEPKVIYEAKVVDIKENESGETVYLVHYAGWNSRYDEWVKRNKIAENLNWTPARSKNSSVTRQASKSGPSKRKPVTGKTEGPSASNTRAATPSTVVSSSTKNKPSAASGGKRVTRNMGEAKPRKRTRRVSNQTDVSLDSESESDSGELVSDGEGDKKTLPSAKEEIVSKSSSSTSSKKMVKKAPNSKKKINKKAEEKLFENNEEDTLKNKRNKKLEVTKEKEVEEKKEDGESTEDGKNCIPSKGRDFDLNEIRSELKGIDKAMKMNTELTIVGGSEETEVSEIKKPVVKVEETTHVTSSATEPPAEEKQEKKIDEKPPEKKDIGDDIYEFKEPEPFEYQEVLRPMNRLYEEGDRSPDKTIKKPILSSEKKEGSKFEVDVKSRFRKTIGKKMRDMSSGEPKKESCSKVDNSEPFVKVEAHAPNDFNAKIPEKEIPTLKAETEPEFTRVFPKVLEEQQSEKNQSVDCKLEISSEKEPTLKSQLDTETSNSRQTTGLSPEPPNLVPVASETFSNNRSPLLNLMTGEVKAQDSLKNENNQEEEDDPISAAIQRVIAQSSMDDDSDDMDLFTVVSASSTVTEEAPNHTKSHPATNEPKPELLIGKKVNSKRKPIGKRIILSKEFVMDDSSSESDSDSAGERLVIVNEDESTNDSNRSQKNIPVAAEEDKKVSVPAADPKSVKGEDKKNSMIPADALVPKKFAVGDTGGSTKKVTSTKADEECKAQKQEKNFEDDGESNLRSLFCEETIPGSPAPLLENKEPPEPKISVLEMQFTSNSQSAALPPPPSNSIKRDGTDSVAVMDNTPPTTPESNLSSMSESPRDDRVGSSSLDNESSKSLRDFSEIDVDNEPDQRGKNLKLPKKPEKDVESPAKKKWRNRKRSESLSEVNKRIRQPVGRPPKAKDLGSDSDDTSENSQTGTHNVNTEALITSRPQKPSKYNFYCELDPELDATQRITLLEQKLQECRKTYMNVKSKLASIDRRRKKLRRREREALKVSKMLERMTDQ